MSSRQDHIETYDVVVIGSGAAGLTAALKARTEGLSVIVIEQSHKFGGTSAVSGGIAWIPNHGYDTDDSADEALMYLKSIASPEARDDRMMSFIKGGPRMLNYLATLGVEFSVAHRPDYFPYAPGFRFDRSITFPKFDGRKLNRFFNLMREQYTKYKLFNRYSMDKPEASVLAMRSRGWLFTAARIISRYWLDVGTRRFTRRDRILSNGAALIGALCFQLFKSGVELRLGTGLKKLVMSGPRVSGVEVRYFGKIYQIEAKSGVIICAGGFEQNQRLRDRYLTVPGLTNWSSTPEGGNRGEALEAALEVGAATEFTEHLWYVQTMVTPIKDVSNYEETHQAVFDVGRPNTLCVNRNGQRFVNESCGYDQFGNAMVEDQKKTGANTPCWMIFDGAFRSKFTAGGILPTILMPDRQIPVDWWDSYIFKADDVGSLAEKIGIAPASLRDTVLRFNDFATTGIDLDFNRGTDAYDSFFGDPAVKPNPCLGALRQGPFYAVPINLGDLGSKGGLRADEVGRVLTEDGGFIPGLYAAGNASGSPFGNCYPGAGGTIGPAMVFGFLAAEHISRDSANWPPETQAASREQAPI